MYLAGIFDNVEGVNCFVVLTTKPNTTVHDIHDRMPLLLSSEQIRPWLTSAQDALQLLTIVPPDLVKTCEDGQLTFSDIMRH
ncbi:SOS response-associated peptidase family protein [Agathobacter sp.]|uniref:SOS response-associated peptidase family protein n=1 Tax=Agathobacter sp. TaxID=2021311 RepID=UPI003FA4A594